MALSPISPQELFLQPIGSETDTSQQQNPVREEDHVLESCLKQSITFLLPLSPGLSVRDPQLSMGDSSYSTVFHQKAVYLSV